MASVARGRHSNQAAAGLAFACAVGVLAVAARAAGTLEADGLRPALQAALERPEPLRIDGRDLAGRALRRLYHARDFAPLWGPDRSGEERALLVLDALTRAADHGLDPAGYHLSATQRRATPATARAAAERELLLSDALLRYASDVRVGRLQPAAVDPAWGIPSPDSYDAAAELPGVAEADSFAGWLRALPPPHPGYARLVEALRRYRRLVAEGGWRPVLSGAPIVPGRRDPRMVALRERLAAEGDLDEVVGDEAADDGTLARAVRRFQRRHGLEPDGIAGEDTLRELNVPVAARITQVALNLERWRWLPRDLGRRHVVVNAADATLAVVEDGRVVLASRVIVGDPLHPTPVVEARLGGLVFNPAWSVPTSIVVEEFLPRLREDPRFLADNDMVILERPGDPHGLEADWKGVSTTRFPYRVQQRPGPMNPLGRVKFVMPNRFDVFLHDTPLLSLFERLDRALSHGCVRVERARELAAYVMAGQRGGSPAAIERAMASGATRGMPVARPVPVYFLYWTAFPDVAGVIHFRDDVYGRDDRLAVALARHGRPRAASAAARPQ